MFRRRTDKIYATLQQVQRRMSQGTEPGEGAAVGSAGPVHGQEHPSRRSAAGPGPLPSEDPRRWSEEHGGTSDGYLVNPDGTRRDPAGARAGSSSSAAGAGSPGRPGSTPRAHHLSLPAGSLTGGGGSPPAEGASPSRAVADDEPEPRRSALTMVEDEAEAPATGNRALELAAKGGRHRRIELSIELATMLAVLWITSVVLAFFLGDRSTADADSPAARSGAGAQVAVGADGDPEAGSGGVRLASAGDHVLVLRSVAATTAEAEHRFRGMARKFNQVANDNDYDPLFGVRRPSGGGLQFVYGQVGSDFGIDKDDARGQRMQKVLSSRFPDAYWVTVK